MKCRFYGCKSIALNGPYCAIHTESLFNTEEDEDE